MENIVNIVINDEVLILEHEVLKDEEVIKNLLGIKLIGEDGKLYFDIPEDDCDSWDMVKEANEIILAKLKSINPDTQNIFGMNHAVDRDKFQKMFVDFVDSNDFDCFSFKNDTFVIFPFSYSIDEGDTDIERPLFIHKKTGFKMYWYKSPLRYAYSNDPELTVEKMQSMIDDCIKSIKEGEENE